MTYTAEISRANPTCFVFLLDQSGSMADTFGGDETARKADFVATVVNRILHDLVIRCTKTEEVRNYYHVAIIGYGGAVQPAFLGTLAGRALAPIAEIAEYPARVENRVKKVTDGTGSLIDQQVRFPIWIDPQANGNTPMCQAFSQVKAVLEQWLSEHKHGFPPTVLHLTDGESTDGDPSELGRQIQSLATNDGPVLLFNCHASSTRAPKVEFPASEANLPDNFSRILFNVSSQLPELFRRTAGEMGVQAPEGARGFVFNADPVAVVQFFEIGTRPANMR